MLVKTLEPFHHGILIRIQRKNLVVLRVIDQLFFFGPDSGLKFGNALIKITAGGTARFGFLLAVLVYESIGDSVNNLSRQARVSVSISNIDQPGLANCKSRLFHGFNSQSLLERIDIIR